ncbi:hypothetical protein Gorai_018052, partial [Gossypium raimondii]|nr:hypothetical protein [Gossypium raimondii]
SGQLKLFFSLKRKIQRSNTSLRLNFQQKTHATSRGAIFSERSTRMEQWTTVAESKSSSPAEEPNRKESDPEMDADEFVIVPTTEPEKEEEKEAQNPKENEVQSERSPNQTSTGSRKSVRWSAELVSESPAADHSVTMSAVNGSNPYIAQSPAPESFSTSFKGKQLQHIYFHCYLSF